MKGGSLGNKLYYVVLVIALLNIIAYLSVQDWKSIGCFVLTGVVMLIFKSSKTIALTVAILGAALCRNVYIEGLEQPKNKIDQLKALMKEADLEGLKNQSSSLVKKQKDLFHMAKKMEPMMKQASKMMSQLPEGFLEKAMQNFNNSSK